MSDSKNNRVKFVLVLLSSHIFQFIYFYILFQHIKYNSVLVSNFLKIIHFTDSRVFNVNKVFTRKLST